MVIVEAACNDCGDTFNPNGEEDWRFGADGRVEYEHFHDGADWTENGWGPCVAAYGIGPGDLGRFEGVLNGTEPWPEGHARGAQRQLQ